jgi:hypothetical protein
MAFSSRNKGQMAVNFQFAHSFFNESLNLHVPLMKNARSLPDLVDFVGAFDHPLFADEP